MKLRHAAGLAAVSVGVCLWLGAAAQSAPPGPSAPERPAGEGAICAWAIYTAIATVGAKCFPGENPDYQAELQQITGKLDAYVARNAKDMTPAKAAEFKRRQGHTETPAEQLCRGDAVMLYRAFERADRPKVRADLDKLLAKDGPPTWGTCL